jgi:hypothetical protein
MKYLLLTLFSFILLLDGCANIPTSHPTFLSSGNIRVGKSIKTWKELREQNVIMQKRDYSCGAAAIATLMRHYFQDDITEKEILDNITSGLNEVELKKRKKKGFSLLDLKKFAERRGYIAMGTKLKLSSLPKLRGPVLVFLDLKDYKHFAILRGIKGNRVFIADPSRGNMRMSIDKFAEEWAGVTLVLGKKGFKTPTEYPLKIQEDELIRPERMAIRRRLGMGW